MIQRLYRSKSDIENLSQLRTSIPDGVDRFDYRRVVVNKPWGYEYLMYENPQVAIWVLYLKHSHKTSMHCHPNKKTSLLVISGSVVCSTLEGWMKRSAGQGIIIEEAVFHSTRAISKDGAIIIEIESPPNKKDLVRLKDEYGREHAAYEGPKKMSHATRKYEYIDFHTIAAQKRISKRLRGCSFMISTSDKKTDIHKRIQNEKGHLLSLLQGKIHDSNGKVVLGTGETIVLSDLKQVSRLYAFGDIMYLTLTYGKRS